MYIGETSRTLEKRLSEHKNAVKTHDIYLQWDCSPCLDQPTPSGLEGHQDKRNGRELRTGREGYRKLQTFSSPDLLSSFMSFQFYFNFILILILLIFPTI